MSVLLLTTRRTATQGARGVFAVTYLLVGEDQEEGVTELIFAEHTLDWNRWSANGNTKHLGHSRSSRASVIRSLSLESTTKMIPWVFWKSVMSGQ